MEISKFNKRLESLKSERSSFMPLWGELSDYHLASRGRFLTSDRNKGWKRNTKQINNSSQLAVRTLASGMMSGITSPARPWFRLTTPDPDMAEFGAVKHWLHRTQEIMYKVFAQSNFYNSIHQTYLELGVFGNGPMGIYSDFENVIHCRPYTAGSYMFGANGKNEIDSFYREYEITVGQCVKQFGIDNVSDHVKRQWLSGGSESWVKVVHIVEPNDDRDTMSPLSKDMPFRSVYYEHGAQSTRENKFLRESGFKQFPITTPRWGVTGEDVYATDCPGILALGDTKALQLGEKRKYQAIDRLVDPTMQAPVSMRGNINKSLRNGDVIFRPNTSDGIESVYKNYNPHLDVVMQINNEAEQRISRAFYEDLFLMLANSDRRQITAREVAEKHEEKLLMLGPVLERLHTESLDVIIDITFSKLQEAGVLPPPPPEIQGMDLKVDYVSVLAQAQRLVSTNSIERLGAYVGNLASVWPEARHKFDAMQSIDEYADSLGTSPSIVRSDDKVAEIVQQEQQAAAQAQAMEQGQQLANTAKTVSETDTAEDNALGQVMRRAGLS